MVLISRRNWEKGGKDMNSLIRRRPIFGMEPRRFWDWGEEDIFKDFPEMTCGERERWVPKVETYRKNGNLVIKADLPGVEVKDIHVSVERGHLTIRGERKTEKDIKKKNLRGREIFYGSFESSLPIPEGLKVDRLKARYHDGVLEITAPVEKRLPSKEIKIDAPKAA
jgi:HSP20 family protein